MYCEKVLYSYLSNKIDLCNDNLEDYKKIANSEKIDYHNFKNSKLPRVEKVLGMLKGIRPSSILDVGYGRGKFLYPFLEEFDDILITTIDKNKHAFDEVRILHKTFYNLLACQGDFLDTGWMDSSYDVLTALEVMEHVEDTEKFISECIRLAKDWIILSVPSKEDNNPGHIHLFTEEKVNKLFSKYGLTPKYEYVLNHMIIKVKLKHIRDSRIENFK